MYGRSPGRSQLLHPNNTGPGWRRRIGLPQTTMARAHASGSRKKAACRANGEANGEVLTPEVAEKKIRITLFMMEIVDKNLELYCMATKKTKTEVVNSTLARFLHDQGIDPYKDQSATVHSAAYTALTNGYSR